jgi:hypothetical protein
MLAQYEYLYDNLVLCSLDYPGFHFAQLKSINLDTQIFDTVLAVYYIRVVLLFVSRYFARLGYTLRFKYGIKCWKHALFGTLKLSIAE